TRTELVLLQKTMVVAEGVARAYDPKLDIWKTCDPVVRSWIEENLGVKAKVEDASRSFVELAKLATHLPQTLAEAELAINRVSKMAQEGVELSDHSLDALSEMRRRSDRWFVLAVVALILLAIWIF
ncbi:MAG: ubiquinone biosynthesis protein UbiB, partial [Methylocystis sp.]